MNEKNSRYLSFSKQGGSAYGEMISLFFYDSNIRYEIPIKGKKCVAVGRKMLKEGKLGDYETIFKDGDCYDALVSLVSRKKFVPVFAIKKSYLSFYFMEIGALVERGNDLFSQTAISFIPSDDDLAKLNLIVGATRRATDYGEK